MFKKIFKTVADKLFNAGKKQPTQAVQPKAQDHGIPEVKPQDAPKRYPKVKIRKLGRNLAKRQLAIKALGKNRKQLREMRIHIRPKVARIRARKAVA